MLKSKKLYIQCFSSTSNFKPTIGLNLQPNNILPKTLFIDATFITAFTTFTAAGLKCQMKLHKTSDYFPFWLLGPVQSIAIYHEIYYF